MATETVPEKEGYIPYPKIIDVPEVEPEREPVPRQLPIPVPA